MANTDMILCEPTNGTATNGAKQVRCTQCETAYPITNGNRVMCNGQLHDDCPYCRPKYDEERKAMHQELSKGALF